MTISLARRQKLTAIAKAHDEWVNENLAGVSSEFDPAAYPKPGSDYNQHNLDVDAPGDAEDELAAKVEAVFGGPLTAAGDPDWDPKEHPRGPDGKFIESGGGAIVKLSPAKLQPGQLIDPKTNEAPKRIKEVVKHTGGVGKGPTFYKVHFEDGSPPQNFSFNEKVTVFEDAPKTIAHSPEDFIAVNKKISETSVLKSIAYMKDEQYEAQTLSEQLIQLEKQLEDMKAAAKKDLDDPPVIPPPPAPAPMAKAKGGQPITAWTKTIYSGKYNDGDVVAVKDDGSQRLVWDEGSKKFLSQKKNPVGGIAIGGWTTSGQLTKKAAYEKFKGEKKNWLTPAPGAAVVDDAPPPLIFDPNPAALTMGAPKSKFTILPRGERGKSGDGYFAPGFWGKYGAAGIMMRHVDDKGTERFLLVQANMSDNPDTFGKWQLPGGALEEFETPEQGAAREAFEELGFDQAFLDTMKQRETHKVTFHPAAGEWSYSNITVDVPTMPTPNFDPNELGGAQWFTAGEIGLMRGQGQIIAPLEKNLDIIMSKFNKGPAVLQTPKDQPLPPPPPRMPTNKAPSVSTQSTGKTTKWTKGKFNTTVATKTKYANGEIVGMTDFAGMYTARVVWESGKFRWYKHSFDKGWQYEGTWDTKKKALSALKDVDFYRPPAGTMMGTNKDYIPGNMLATGDNVISVNDSTEPDVLSSLIDNVPVSTGFVPDKFGKLVTKPWHTTSAGGKAHADHKTSMLVESDGEHIGAIHEKKDGIWLAVATAERKPYMPSTEFFEKIHALQALAQADDAYRAAKASATAPVKPTTNIKTKKVAKLTAAQIEKQNGAVPKTMKSTQKANFLKHLKEKSSVGFIHSGETSAEKVFTALVEAVKRHNSSQTPKLNYLQGISVLDGTYGSKQKENIVAWLKTSEGKALAPILANDVTGTGGGKVVPAPAHTGVPSPYDISTPKKVHPTEFRTFSLSETLDMHEEMYKGQKLDSNQISTIREYMGSSDDFNEPLRGKSSMSAWKLNQIQTLQSVMRPTTKSITVIRGTDGLGSAINRDTIKSLSDLKRFEGAVVGDPAFLSTSIDPYGAFSGKKFKLIINVPQGTPASFLYANGGGMFEQEKEMLLAAGLHYRIDQVEDSYGTYKIYMTVVPKAKK